MDEPACRCEELFGISEFLARPLQPKFPSVQLGPVRWTIFHLGPLVRNLFRSVPIEIKQDRSKDHSVSGQQACFLPIPLNLTFVQTPCPLQSTNHITWLIDRGPQATEKGGKNCAWRKLRCQMSYLTRRTRIVFAEQYGVLVCVSHGKIQLSFFSPHCS